MKAAKAYLPVLLFSLSLGSISSAGEPLRNVTVSWLGNSFPGAEKWVQQDIHAMAVAPDGSVYTNVEWDEAGRNVGIYKDGDVVGIARHTHGWGYEGGRAIALNSRYLFIGQKVDNEGGGLNDPGSWPPRGKSWIGVSRRIRADITRAAPFAGAKGGKGDTLAAGFLVVAEIPERGLEQIAGLAADDRRLFVSDQASSSIQVYDAETMAPGQRWKVTSAGPLVLDRHGTLWMLQEAHDHHPGRVVHYSPDGKPLPQTVEFPLEVLPAALGIDAVGERLFVADQGIGQQVRIYSDLDSTPRLLQLFGSRGGIFAGVPGRFDALKFNNPSAVGGDAAGNVYVACDGQTGGGGTVLQSYKPDGTLRGGCSVSSSSTWPILIPKRVLTFTPRKNILSFNCPRDAVTTGTIAASRSIGSSTPTIRACTSGRPEPGCAGSTTSTFCSSWT